MDFCIVGFEKIFEYLKVEFVILFVVIVLIKVINFICYIFNKSDLFY